MIYNKRQVGKEKEQLAGAYLEKNGYEIIEYNFHCRQGEIDIIAKDEEYLVFCEVKYRSGKTSGTPFEAVDYKKQKTISRCAHFYIAKNNWQYLPCRFDVVGITDEEITLLKNAFDYIGPM